MTRPNDEALMNSVPDDALDGLLTTESSRHQHEGEVSQATGDLDDARQHFRQAVLAATESPQTRLEKLCLSVERESRRLARRQTLWVMAVCGLILVGTGVPWLMARSGQPAAPFEPPRSFVRWLALLQLETLVDWRFKDSANKKGGGQGVGVADGRVPLPNPRLRTPDAMLKSLLAPVPRSGGSDGAKEVANADAKSDPARELRPPTAKWLPADTAGVVVRPEDIPSGEGPARHQLLNVLKSAVSYHEVNKDGASIRALIDAFGKENGWRVSEASVKAWCEMSAAFSFLNVERWDDAEAHAGRAIAAGLSEACNAYLMLCRIRASRPDPHVQSARDAWRVACDVLEYLDENSTYDVAYLIGMYRGLGAGAWEYLGDADSYLSLSDKALQLLEQVKSGKRRSDWSAADLESLEFDIHTDRLEFFVISRRSSEFEATLPFVKRNDALTPSYEILVSGLQVMHLVQQGKHRETSIIVKHAILPRYRDLDDYVVGWGWQGLRRHFKSQAGQQITDEDALTMAMLIDALENGKTAEKLSLLEQVGERLRVAGAR